MELLYIHLIKFIRLNGAVRLLIFLEYIKRFQAISKGLYKHNGYFTHDSFNTLSNILRMNDLHKTKKKIRKNILLNKLIYNCHNI